jgi:hypothetical protein
MLRSDSHGMLISERWREESIPFSCTHRLDSFSALTGDGKIVVTAIGVAGNEGKLRYAQVETAQTQRRGVGMTEGSFEWRK